MKPIYTDNRENITKELADAVNLFNKYNDKTMKLVDTGFDVELWVGEKKITESCDMVVTERVKNINHSYGYDYLD